MPNYRRRITPGGTFFFTVNTYRRQPMLTHTAVLDALQSAVRETRTKLPFSIVAWVVLPDHLHAIWNLPEGDSDFSLRWSLIKQHVTRACRGLSFAVDQSNASRLRRREGTLWQRRFWEHQVRDEADLLRHVEYIHYNPVKHGHVLRVRDWPYSTFHRYVREGRYSLDWGDSKYVDEIAAFGE
jgi:putative transposase